MKIVESDLIAAMQHADTYGDQGWSLSDFDIKELGVKSMTWIRSQEDIDSWVDQFPEDYAELNLEEKFELLDHFRGPEWSKMARNWIETKSIPPIVIIDAPLDTDYENYTQVGDGRGRVNLAVALGLSGLPVVRMTYKKLAPKPKAASLKLFKKANLKSAVEKASSAGNQIKGSLWAASNDDPGFTDIEYKQMASALADWISGQVLPTDISDEDFLEKAFKFTWNICLDKIAKNISAELLTDEPASSLISQIKKITSAFVYSQSIEDFYKIKQYAGRADQNDNIVSYKTFPDLDRAIIAIEDWTTENLNKKGLYEKHVTQKQQHAAENTTFLLGTDLKPITEKGTMNRADDLINGEVDPTEWQIVVPETKEAACYWGFNTKWCTSHLDDQYNKFEVYHKDDPLIIFINKRTKNRYQWHFASNSFMDADDRPVSSTYLTDQLYDMAYSKLNSYFATPELGTNSLIKQQESLPAERTTKDAKGYAHSDGKKPSLTIGSNFHKYHNHGEEYAVLRLSNKIIYAEWHPLNAEFTLDTNNKNDKGKIQLRDQSQQSASVYMENDSVYFGVQKNGPVMIHADGTPISITKNYALVSENSPLYKDKAHWKSVAKPYIEKAHEAYKALRPAVNRILIENDLTPLSKTAALYAQLIKNANLAESFTPAQMIKVANYADIMGDSYLADYLDTFLL